MPETQESLDQLAEMARSLEHEQGIQKTLQLAVSAATRIIEACDLAGVSIADRKAVRTRAATDAAVLAMHELQYQLGEDPDVETLRDHEAVYCPDLSTDERRPRWGPRVVQELDVRSVASYRLFTTSDTLGALNLFSRTCNAFDTEDIENGLALAAHVAVAVAEEQNDEQLHSALATRTVIGQAQGILMGRFGLTADHAFQVLIRFSTHQNVKLHRVASQLVATRKIPSSPPSDEVEQQRKSM